MAETRLSKDFWQQIDTFATLLLNYNKTHNISGAKSKEVVLKNVEDSIYPLEFLELDGVKNAIDIGSGAGFPAIPLAIALPDIHFTLFEPIAKKSSFLHLVKVNLGLENITIATSRVEKAAPFEAELICSRAVTNTKMLLSLCKNYITPQTTLLFYKGVFVVEEIKGLENCKIYQREKRYYLVMKDAYAC